MNFQSAWNFLPNRPGGQGDFSQSVGSMNQQQHGDREPGRRNWRRRRIWGQGIFRLRDWGRSWGQGKSGKRILGRGSGFWERKSVGAAEFSLPGAFQELGTGQIPPRVRTGHCSTRELVGTGSSMPAWGQGNFSRVAHGLKYFPCPQSASLLPGAALLELRTGDRADSAPGTGQIPPLVGTRPFSTRELGTGQFWGVTFVCSGARPRPENEHRRNREATDREQSQDFSTTLRCPVPPPSNYLPWPPSHCDASETCGQCCAGLTLSGPAGTFWVD